MILESILSGIISTLSGVLFGNIIDTATVKIDHAPSWYEQSDDSGYMYTYATTEGDVSAVRATKDQARNLMVKKIGKIVEITIEKRFEYVKDEDEKELLKRFSQDEHIDNFVETNGHYKNIEQDEGSKNGLFSSYRPSRVFVSFALNKNELIRYEERRLREIASQLTKYKSNKSFKELDAEMSKKGQ